jgi:hypothetical protein
MAIETKKKDIGGLHFEVEQLPYFAAQRLFFRLLKLSGPGLLGLLQIAGVTSGASVISALGEKDVKDLAPLLSAFFEKLDPAEMEELTGKILETARVRQNGKLVPLLNFMDAIIGGDFWTGLAVQAFALSVHFGNFNSARSALDSLGLKVNKASPSEESSTSTDSTDGISSAKAG